MIASVRGPVMDIALDHAVIDCGGVGYRVLATPTTLASLRRDEESTLLTSMIVREDSMTLYGFTDADARTLFAVLQTVSGVGPRLAMAILSVLDPEELRRALADSDLTTLTTVPGVGKRVAERLAVELRDKVERPVGGVSTGAGGSGALGRVADQVVEALTGLGFTAAAAEKTVHAVLAEDPGADASTALRSSLAGLGKK